MIALLGPPPKEIAYGVGLMRTVCTLESFRIVYRNLFFYASVGRKLEGGCGGSKGGGGLEDAEKRFNGEEKELFLSFMRKMLT